MKLKIFSRFILIFSFLVVLPVYAQPVYYQQQNQQQTMPGELLREGIGKLLSFVEGGGSRDEAKLRHFVEREIAPYFDFAYMTQWVAGPRYRNMNHHQRIKLQQELQSMFLSAMLSQLAAYESTRVQFLRPRGNPGGREITLGIQSFSRQGYPMRLSFRMYRSQPGWKVFDVSANGQSALIHFRDYFAQQYHHQQRPQRSPRSYYQNSPQAYYR